MVPEKFDGSIKYWITGWGVTVNDNGDQNTLTAILQEAQIELYNFGKCNSMAPEGTTPLTDNQFCAGGGCKLLFIIFYLKCTEIWNGTVNFRDVYVPTNF